MARVLNMLRLLGILIACAVGLAAVRLILTIERVAASIPPRIAAIHRDVDQQLTALRSAADAQATATRNAAIREVSAMRADLNGPILSTLDRRLGSIEATADRQLGRANDTLALSGSTISGSIATITTRYTLLPDQLAAAAAPSWSALEPEFTCRRPDGSGYGGCAHSRVNALLGEAARAGGVFAQDFPALSGSITGIATDAHTFTSRAVAPCKGWCLVRSILTTSSGAVRAAGAAGIF